ncbi:MAG: PspC domain-containing protein [Verrucomicrobium sp.]|nr:PspC domain-containing protein [Verrucomicrobium sp.]
MEETPSAPSKRLYKSRDRKLCGVCGGLAEYFDMDPTVVRILWVVVTLFTVFSGAVAYGILALVMPDQDELK